MRSSGFAAIGILMTLPLKRPIDSTRGSLPRIELPTAERWRWNPARRAYKHLSSIIYLLSSDSRKPIRIPLSASQTSPFEKGRLTTSGFTARSDTSPISSSRAVEACQSMLSIRIATATTSREIFLVNDYDGIFKERVEFQRLRRKSIRIPLSLRDIPPLEKGDKPSACGAPHG